MTPLQERRHREVINTLNRTVAQRDGCLANLVRYEARLKLLRQRLARLERTAAATTPKPAPVKPTDDEPIPAFLDRRKLAEADAIDAKARAEIEQANAERKRIKSQVRIEKLKAKQSGETRRMPLTGKAALAHIHERT